MAPGPQKRFSNQKATVSKTPVSENKKATVSNTPVSENKKATVSKTPVSENKKALLPNSELEIPQNETNEKELTDVSDKKYAKRVVKNNWDKYNEPVIDKHADVKRGNEFETMLNYSGGTNSQLQLLDEKDWNETCTDDKNISIDFPNLISSLKCIPLHTRLNLEENIFDSNQVSRFILIAENNEKQYFSNNLDQHDVQSIHSETMFSSLNIIENSESEDVDTKKQQSIKSCGVKSNTENLIESLASCLSIKDKTPGVECLKEEPSSLHDSLKSTDTTDDLDFLLSLSDKSNIVGSNTNVDDWLSNILDN